MCKAKEVIDKKTVAKEGDLIRIVTDYSQEPYEKGDILFVIEVDEDGDLVETLEHGIYYVLQEEYEVVEVSSDVREKLRELNVAKVMNESKLSVGDYVILNPEYTRREDYKITNEDMLLGKITRDSTFLRGRINIEVVSHEFFEYEGKDYDVEAWFFQKADEDTIRKHSLGNPFHILKEGDYAKVTMDLGISKEGDVVKVTDVCFDRILTIKAFNERTKTATMLLKEHLRKIELTERELSFIREGRKVGEVRYGDIIKWTDNSISEVFSIAYNLKTVTLVCPVEKRTDNTNKETI